MKNRIYIASTLTNAPRVRELRDALAVHNIELTYDWTSHNDGVPYIPDSNPEEKQQAALREELAVREAEVVLVVIPGGHGTHFEFGMARALYKPIVWLDDQPIPPPSRPCFHFFPDLIRVHSNCEAITAIVKILDDDRVRKLAIQKTGEILL